MRQVMSFCWRIVPLGRGDHAFQSTHSARHYTSCHLVTAQRLQSAFQCVNRFSNSRVGVGLFSCNKAVKAEGWSLFKWRVAPAACQVPDGSTCLTRRGDAWTW